MKLDHTDAKGLGEGGHFNHYVSGPSDAFPGFCKPRGKGTVPKYVNNNSEVCNSVTERIKDPT